MFKFILFIITCALGYLRPYLEYIVWYRLADATEWRSI